MFKSIQRVIWRRVAFTAGLFVLIWRPAPMASDAAGNSNDLIKAVVLYIEKTEPLESYEQKPPKTRIRAAQVIDIDQDGVDEIFILIEPRYLQTPPVFVYQASPDGAVSRVKEALAPGPLTPNDYALKDTHSTGTAADMGVGGLTPPDRQMLTINHVFIKSHVVAYPDFIHTDHATDGGYVVDMTRNHGLSDRSVNPCGAYRYARIDEIAAGRAQPAGKPVFFARVGTDVYALTCAGIADGWFVGKQVARVLLPADFKAFERSLQGRVVYRTTTGEIKDFPGASAE